MYLATRTSMHCLYACMSMWIDDGKRALRVTKRIAHARATSSQSENIAIFSAKENE